MRQRNTMGDPAAESVRKGSDRASRMAIRLAFAAIMAGIIWAHYTVLPEVAFAPGRLEPVQPMRRIEHPDGGIVSQIAVLEGQIVEEGELILQLSENDINAEAQALEARAKVYRDAAARASDTIDRIGMDPFRPARTDAEDPVVASNLARYEIRRSRLAERVAAREVSLENTKELITVLQSQIDYATDEVSRFETLISRQATTGTQLADRRLRLLEISQTLLRTQGELQLSTSELDDARDALREFHEETRIEFMAEDTEARDNLFLIARSLQQIELRRARLTVRMPQTGTIQSLFVSTGEEVVDPGALLAEFMPLGEELFASVRLRPIDAGHVSIGDPVDVRLTTFEVKRFGTLPGKVHHIAATSQMDERGEYFFKVLVRLERQSIGEDENLRKLRPGIEAAASIITGHRSVLRYALDPLLAPFRDAFQER